MSETTIADAAADLRDHGFVILEGAVPVEAVESARRSVLENLQFLKNTRPNPSSGHSAGFHRHPELEHLHMLVSTNTVANAIIAQTTGAPRVRSIGLSDITLNRSQPWHVDLLRGRYRKHLDADLCWGPEGGGVFKVLLYLQRGASLRVIPGAHAKPVPLDDDRKVEPQDETEALAVPVEAGSLVIMDIRLPHRGSSEEELATPASLETPKILVSTVLAGSNRPLGGAMERGNFERLLDWDDLHRNAASPKLAAYA